MSADRAGRALFESLAARFGEDALASEDGQASPTAQVIAA